jgi:hypothetical protein
LDIRAFLAVTLRADKPTLELVQTILLKGEQGIRVSSPTHWQSGKDTGIA